MCENTDEEMWFNDDVVSKCMIFTAKSHFGHLFGNLAKKKKKHVHRPPYTVHRVDFRQVANMKKEFKTDLKFMFMPFG